MGRLRHGSGAKLHVRKNSRDAEEQVVEIEGSEKQVGAGGVWGRRGVGWAPPQVGAVGLWVGGAACPMTQVPRSMRTQKFQDFSEVDVVSMEKHVLGWGTGVGHVDGGGGGGVDVM